MEIGDLLQRGFPKVLVASANPRRGLGEFERTTVGYLSGTGLQQWKVDEPVANSRPDDSSEAIGGNISAVAVSGSSLPVIP